MFYTDINQKKLSQKVSEKLGECIFSHVKTLKASGALRHPRPYKLTSLMRLCHATLAKLGWPELGPPQTHPKSLKKKKKVKICCIFFFLKNKKRIFLNKQMKFYIDFQCQNITKRYSENRENAYLAMKNLSASRALDPPPTSACFACVT